MERKVDPKDKTQYIDELEQAAFYLKYPIDALYGDLGLRGFLIERDGYYNPTIILEKDWRHKGEEYFDKYSKLVKSKICPLWKNMNESGLLKDTLEIYMFVMGALIGQDGQDVPRAFAVPMATIIAKRGLNWLCQNANP
jgi:hypothetical protein